MLVHRWINGNYLTPRAVAWVRRLPRINFLRTAVTPNGDNKRRREWFSGLSICRINAERLHPIHDMNKLLLSFKNQDFYRQGIFV